MNLEQSITYSHLMQAPPTKVVEPTKRSKLDVAKRVFHLAASGGFPYKSITPEGWAKKWLSSKEFLLMEIDINAAASLNINAVASPHKPKNPNRVAHYFNCSSDTFDPIVVDLNKRNQGRSYLGYIPEIVVFDGKHRKAAQLQQGRTKILAWVGCEAANKLFKLKKVVRVVDAAHEDITLPPVDPTKIATSFELYAATVPAVGLKSVSPRQDAGEGGPRPTGIHSKKMKGMGGAGPGASNQGGSGANPLRMNIRSRSTDSIKAELKELLASKDRNNLTAERVRKLAGELKRRFVQACGARSSGSLVKNLDSSDRKVPPDASDAGPFVDSSDELTWDGHKPQVNAPGTRGWSSETTGVNPAAVAPGTGVGPRLKPDTGATRSEMSRTVFAGGPGSGRRKTKPDDVDDEDEKMNNARELKRLNDKEYFHGLDDDEYDRQYNLEHYGRPSMSAKKDCKCKGKCAKCKDMKAKKFVSKMWHKYKKDVAAGYRPRIEAVAPKGWEGTVKKMKQHSEITNPWALAHWMKDKGYSSHKGKK